MIDWSRWYLLFAKLSVAGYWAMAVFAFMSPKHDWKYVATALLFGLANLVLFVL